MFLKPSLKAFNRFQKIIFECVEFKILTLFGMCLASHKDATNMKTWTLLQQLNLQILNGFFSLVLLFLLLRNVPQPMHCHS